MSEPRIMFVATTLAGLHKEPSFISELLTQVTNGVEVQILEERDKWCRVRQIDGYEGWAYSPYLVDERPIDATHITLSTMLVFEQPQPGPILTRIPIGTSLRVEETRELWTRVRACTGITVPDGWVITTILRDMTHFPVDPKDARGKVVAAARSLIGTYYLWGGCTDWGIDCSGLAQLTHRLAGYEIPRDARLQFPASKPVEPPFQAGDLLFFAGNADDPKRITHVGIATGEGWRMIHSSRGRNGVYEEDVEKSDTLRKQFVRGGTFLPES